MSDALFRTRVRWSAASGRGLVCHDGVSIELQTRPPVLQHVARMVELDYIPAIGVMYLQDPIGPRRDLADSEARELARWVQTVARAARQCASGDN